MGQKSEKIPEWLYKAGEDDREVLIQFEDDRIRECKVFFDEATTTVGYALKLAFQTPEGWISDYFGIMGSLQKEEYGKTWKAYEILSK